MSANSRVKWTQAITGEFFALIIALVLATALSFLLLIPLLLDGSYYEGKYLLSEGFETILILLLLECSFIAVYFWRRADYKETINSWKNERKKFSLLTLIVIGIVSGIVMWLFNYSHDLILINLLGKESVLSSPWLEFSKFPILEKIFIYILGVTIVPLAEELFFREMMFGNILRKDFTYTAYIFSILFFAFLHFDFTGLLVYLFYGFVLASLYHQTRSLLTPIVAHIILNAIALSFLIK